MATSSMPRPWTAASTCSTVCTSAVPSPSTVRRSVAWTAERCAGISGAPGRSVRRKTMPRPAGAGSKVSEVALPVWSPVPRTVAARSMPILPTGGTLLGQVLELSGDPRQPGERGLAPELLPVRPGGVAAHVGAGRHGGGDAGLGADPGAPPEGQVAADPRLPAHDDDVAQRGAAGCAHPRPPQAVAAAACVVPHAHPVVQLGPGADDGAVHAPPVHAGVGARLDVGLQDATADVLAARVAVSP